jgi:MFS family permease
MGVIRAAGMTPFLLFGLIVGAWVDRLPKRTVLAASDVARGLVLATIPAAAIAGALRIEWLYVVAFLVGTITVFFDVAYQAFLPFLVGNEQLVDGNSKLQLSNSTASVVGPGLAGALVQAIGAPLAILVDSASYLVSAASLLWIKAVEEIEESVHKTLIGQVREGLAFVFRHPILLPGMAWIGLFNFFNNASSAVAVLYIVRDLHLNPLLLGLVYTLGAPGFMLGAALAGRVVKAIGIGNTQLVAVLVVGVGLAATPLAAGSLQAIVVELAAGSLVFGVGLQLANISWQSLRMAITPARLQSRTLASFRLVAWGAIPLGALLGGFLGQTIGLRPTLWLAVAGCVATFVVVLMSGIRSIREVPTAPPA